MTRRWIRCLMMVIGVSLLAQAEGVSAQAEGLMPETAQDLPDPELVAKLKALRPDIPIEAVLTTPLEGIYALELTGGTVLYGTADGRYLFAGDMYELREEGLVNLTEDRRTRKRRVLIDEVAIDDMAVFPAAGERKAVINVFTDVDCSYCRKLHLEMADLNALGIEVRYLAYPRAGVGSRSYQKIVSAWCSGNRNAAITELKLGKSIPDRTCQNPVADHFELGRLVGVTGTPAIVTEDGRLLPGYMAASDLAAAIGL
ncbi:MAG: DsbC family protein [Gammaproteobacteria bacterium]|nr:DsbC family protein [Gammaproteobacteria bacterium]